MKINKAKASDYNTVRTDCIVDYIKEYSRYINADLENYTERLNNANRTQLKEIAAELETVCKRLNLIIRNQY